MIEDQLLFLAARLEPSPDAENALRSILSQRVDWDRVLDLAQRHNVVPLLRASLQRLQVRDVPPSFEQALEQLHRQGKEHSEHLWKELPRVLAALDGLDVMLLKELCFAEAVYGDPGLRALGDLDFLVRASDREEAIARLWAIGYRPHGGRKHYNLRYGSGFHMVSPNGTIWLDPQWNHYQISWENPATMHFEWEDDLWATSGATTISGHPVRMMALEHLLVHLCLHPEGHNYDELVQLCDLAEVLRHYRSRIDWDRFVGILKRYHIESSAYFALRFVDQLLGAPVPQQVFEQIRPLCCYAPLQKALFGNLGALHNYLDVLAPGLSPQDDLMLDLEHLVRSQASAAAGLWQELTAITDSAAPSFLAWQAENSPRQLPLADLAAFGRIWVFVEERDLPSLCTALDRNGYHSSGIGWTRTLNVEVADGPRAGSRHALCVRWELYQGLPGKALPRGGLLQRERWLRLVRLTTAPPRHTSSQAGSLFHDSVVVEVFGLPDDQIPEVLSGHAIREQGVVDWLGLCSILLIMDGATAFDQGGSRIWFARGSVSPLARALEDLTDNDPVRLAAAASGPLRWLGAGRNLKAKQRWVPDTVRRAVFTIWIAPPLPRFRESLRFLSHAVPRQLMRGKRFEDTLDQPSRV